jgi:topoisomerase-4 subunit A
MARSKGNTEEIIEKISDYSLHEIMESGFGRYSKEIIQERALPDVRDGLKPVQRRILFAMKKAGYTSTKPYQKSAKSVGYIMGNFHPHGDSSIYDAMIRMSQKWKMRETFIDVHGNNGSIDGDGPAASRYTESRLSKIAEVMLSSIEKNTVEMTWNFDDTEKEPTVLPAMFPNLLVNGASGISAGYATDIPTHNLSEVIEATIKRIDSPNCRLDTILEIMPGPDFPTGGVIEGKNELYKAYETGKGKVVLKADCEINKNKIIIKSIPYEVVKEQLIKKITDIKLDKKIEGINDIIDESDHNNMARIVIDLKKDANAELILNYLYKNTDLQTNYNFNMVAIVNKRPKYVGVLDILDAFISHLREVITRRTEFDLEHAKRELHILEGLVKAISILDDVIKTIRESKNKSNAIENLVEKFKFSPEQAKAIVELQLYRLTNTDVVALTEQMESLKKTIEALTAILSDEEALKYVMKKELKLVKKEYGNDRRTKIIDEISEIKIDVASMIPKEKTLVVVTNEGYVKRVSIKSFNARDGETTLKPGDYVTNLVETTTIDNLVLFTNLGNYLFVPVHKIMEAKWKELGKHVSNIVPLTESERVIASFILEDSKELTLFTKLGMVKTISMKDLYVTRYSKTMTAMKLKDHDELISVSYTDNDTLIVTKNGYYLRYSTKEIPVVGLKTSGVKGINLSSDEVVFGGCINNTHEYLNIFTNNNTSKRIKIEELKSITRAKKGNMLIKKNKTVTYYIVNAYLTNTKDIIIVKSDSELREIKNSEIPIMDIYSNGSNIAKGYIDKYDIKYDLVKIVNDTSSKEESAEEEVKIEKQVSFEDFAKDFKI